MQFYLFFENIKEDQSAGNQTLLNNEVGSSETTRDTDYFQELASNNFNTWFAGLIDGNGTLGFSVNGVEILLDEKDVKVLHYIKKTLGFGSVTKRTNVKAFRYRIYAKGHVLDILKRVNGYLLTQGKHKQLVKLCEHFHIEPIIPDYNKSLDIIKNTCWLQGFFDAEGHFNIMNKYMLAFHIGQKDRYILDLIKDALNFGHIHHDISYNSWTYSITNKEGIRFILAFFSKNKLQTMKNIDVVSLKRILYFLDLQHHFNNNPKKPAIDNLINLFKNRHKNLK